MWFLQPGITIQDILFHVLASWLIVALVSPINGFIQSLVAYKLGDDTAKSQGFMSFNPINHFSLYGFLSLLLFRIGWTNAVPINSHNFKSPRKGSIIVGIVGIISYIVAAILGAVAMYLLLFFCVENYILTLFVSTYIVVNIGLAVFNLLPLKNLDGYKILTGILPEKVLNKYQKYQGVVELIIFTLIIFGTFDVQYDFLIEEVMKIIFKITSLPFLFIR